MARTKVSQNQPTLPGIEQALCGCGCGQYFMRSTRGRSRLYINDTHKKRAARKLAKARRAETTVHITPIGWLYLEAVQEDKLAEMWEQFSRAEQALIRLCCEDGFTPEDLALAGSNLWEWTYLFRSDRAGS